MIAIFVRILAAVRTAGPFVVKMAGKLKWLKNAVLWLFASEAVRRSVAVGIALSVYAMFYQLMQKIGDNVSTLGLAGAGNGMHGMAGAISAVDRSFLSKVNYVFPLDTFATVVGIYASIWVAVTCFLWLNRMFDIASGVYEKKPGQ